MLDFVNITFIDILDIVLVGFLIFEIIKFFRKTAAIGVFSLILLFYVAWIVVKALGMKLLSFIMGQILGVGVISLLIIFQPEVRRFLINMSMRLRGASRRGILARLFAPAKKEAISQGVLEELTAACNKMSQTKTGALIVIRHNANLEEIIESGDVIDADLNRRLIENIFFKNTPLHDGAMIISSTRIIAARCTLPLSANENIPPKYGMRHKAAIGISEVSDASVIVVSEETGGISFIEKGIWKEVTSIAELKLDIENSFK